MLKRIAALLLALSMLTLAMVGCSSTETTSQPAETTSTDTTEDTTDEAATGEEVAITVLCAFASEDPHGQYIYEYAETFMAANENTSVEIQAISSNDIYTKLAAMATTPDDIPTLFFTSADAVATLHDLGITQDLNSVISQEDIDGLANGVYDATMLGGAMSFYPVSVQPTAIIYRTDRFEEAGFDLPTTWDEFIDMNSQLIADTDGDGETDQWGFSMVGSNNSSGQSRFLSYLWSNGFDVVYEEDGVWMTDVTADGEFLEVFTQWTDMNANGIVPIGITEVDYATAANYFAMGYTSTFMTGPNALGVTYATSPDLEGKLGSFPMPGDAPGTMLNAEGYAMSAYASDEQKAVAAEFLTHFATGDTEMNFWKSSGKIPATTEGQTVEYLSGDDYAGFLQQIENGTLPTVTFPGISGLKSVLGDAYSAVFSGEKDNEQAVADLLADIDELLLDYN